MSFKRLKVSIENCAILNFVEKVDKLEKDSYILLGSGDIRYEPSDNNSKYTPPTLLFFESTTYGLITDPRDNSLANSQAKVYLWEKLQDKKDADTTK